MTYRRPGSEARHVRNLVFDRLPSVVRERLAVCLAENGAPEPLLVDASRRRPPSARRWRILAAAAAVAEIVLWFKGFGDVDSPLVIQPLAFAAAHGAALFALIFSLLRAARIARGQGGAPFPDGRYLFELDLVEVEGRSVRLTDLHTLRRVEARPGKRGTSVVLVFADAHEITFEAQPRAESLAVRVKAAVDAAVTLILPDDQPRLERLDPFFELRVADDWASAEDSKAARRSLLMRAPLPALAAALLVASALAGLGIHALRNRLSDDGMFAQAGEIPGGTADADRWKIGRYTGVRHEDALDALRLERARGNEEALKAYLRKPGAREGEAKAALFEIWKSDPKALAAEIRRKGEFAKQAEEALYDLQKGDLDDLAGYIRHRGPRGEQADDQLFALAQKSGEPKSYRFYLKHGKRHIDEVQSSLLPEAAYREVTKKDDVGLLGEFVREYPDSAHVEEIKAKVHAIYADALRAYEEKKPSAAGLRFFTALLAELEARADPSVTVEVDVNESPSIAAADAKLTKRYGEDYVPAALELEGSALRSMEGQIRADLVTWIMSSFARGTVRPTSPGLGFETGRPVIVIACEPTAVDTILALPGEKLRLSDVRFRVDFHAVVPARSQELAWKLTTSGLKAVDVAAKGEDARAEIERLFKVQVSYPKMRTAAATQILDRFKLDF